MSSGLRFTEGQPTRPSVANPDCRPLRMTVDGEGATDSGCAGSGQHIDEPDGRASALDRHPPPGRWRSIRADGEHRAVHTGWRNLSGECRSRHC